MRMSGFRTPRVIIFVCACLWFAHVIWSYTGRKVFIQSERYPGNDLELHKKLQGHAYSVQEKPNDGRNASLKPVEADDAFVCSKIVPFSNIAHGRISTYDLPAETDYNLGFDQRYKLPAEFLNSKGKDEDIHVILVPFSHSDPGYGRTVEHYYTGSTKSVLNNMVEFLSTHRNMTFQWVETVFLERWFRDITEETKQMVRQLISRGQLEIVLGGWVMPDEAITHYAPVIDQLIEGHQWLMENLGVAPVNAWINDPFGYSSTMPYLWKSSGIENMVILRIHQAIKHTLMRKRSLDFMWRPYWNSENENDIMCNLMPYTEYWNSNVCGPDINVCKKFNFLHLTTHNRDQTEAVSGKNIDALATTLYKAYKFTASLYQYNNLVIFIGEDNSFDTKNSWIDTYTNYGKLMSYINTKSEWKMHIKFGTIREYFQNVRMVEEKTTTTSKFPVLSGDFFPYSEKENDYWTGYFTTRPWLKRLAREVEPLVRAGDKFSVLLYNVCIISKRCPIIDVYKDILRELRAARRDVGILQHHDAITGTSIPYVVADYEQRLMNAFKSAQAALTSSITLIMSEGKVKEPNALIDNNDKAGARSILTPKVFKFKENRVQLLVVNTLEKARNVTVSFYLDKRYISVSNVLTYQISESVSSKFMKYNLITISVTLNPFEIKSVEITAINDGMNVSPYVDDNTKSSSDTREILVIENRYMKVEFHGINGSLKCITDTLGRKTAITSEFLKYKPDKSGAYLFGPSGPAKRISELSQPDVSVSSGPVFSQVRVSFKSGFRQKWTLFHGDDMNGQALYITQEITLGLDPHLVESEVILRFKTDVDNGDIFFTDQNGFQLIGRKNNLDRPIETNYYPITTMAVIEDSTKRLTLHSAQCHGVASLGDGWLEVMLDRNMRHDDKKGLGMGATERVETLTEFILQLEYKSVASGTQEVRYTHASISSTILNEQLQNKAQLFSVEQHIDKFGHRFEPFRGRKLLPCDLSIVGLRALATNDLNYNATSLVLHRKPTHCMFPVHTAACSLSNTAYTLADFRLSLGSDVVIDKLTETTLTHLHRTNDIRLTDDIRPRTNELRAFLIQFGIRDSVRNKI